MVGVVVQSKAIMEAKKEKTRKKKHNREKQIENCCIVHSEYSNEFKWNKEKEKAKKTNFEGK